MHLYAFGPLAKQKIDGVPPSGPGVNVQGQVEFERERDEPAEYLALDRAVGFFLDLPVVESHLANGHPAGAVLTDEGLERGRGLFIQDRREQARGGNDQIWMRLGQLETAACVLKILTDGNDSGDSCLDRSLQDPIQVVGELGSAEMSVRVDHGDLRHNTRHHDVRGLPMTRPLVSVLMPVRNGVDHLDECRASLEAQTLSDFEIVVVDDASSDATPERLAAWRQSEPRLKVLDNPNPGLIPALNLGLRHCRADLVARMDADDRAHPDRLLRQSALMDSNPGLTVAACWVRHFTAGSIGKGLQIYERWLNSLVSHEEILRDRFVESPIPHPGAMFRRKAIVSAGGYQDRGWPEDYDLWLRLAAAGHRFQKVPQVLHFWRDRPDRLTRTDRRYAVERFLECKAEHLMSGPAGNCRELVVWGSGQTGRRITKHLLRRGAHLSGFIDIDPAKWGRTVRGVKVFPPSELEELAKRRHKGLMILAAVSSRGARTKIRTALDRAGWRETENYWCAA